MSIEREREDIKIEMINGQKIISMSPAFSNHAIVKLNISLIFGNHLRNSVCMVMPDDVKVVLDDNSYVEPDMFVICDRSKIRENGVYGCPDLVVEVLSDSTEKRDRGTKKDKYQESGVKEYWLVDTRKKMIEVYLLTDSSYYLDEVYRYPNPAESEEDQAAAITIFNVNTFPELCIDLDEVFRNVADW